MAELHDQALADEQASELQDRDDKALAERLEDERQQLQDFADWMETYSGESAQVCYSGNEAFLPIVMGGMLTMINGEARPFGEQAGRNLTPYRALWAIYQKETQQPS